MDGIDWVNRDRPLELRFGWRKGLGFQLEGVGYLEMTPCFFMFGLLLKLKTLCVCYLRLSSYFQVHSDYRPGGVSYLCSNY